MTASFLIGVLEPKSEKLWLSWVFAMQIHSSLLRTFGLSATSTYHYSLEYLHWFEAIFKMFPCAVFEDAEVTEVKQPRNPNRRKF